MAEGQGKHEKEQPGASLTVTVHNEDAGGDPVRMNAGPGTPVSTIIDRFYRETQTERKTGDRLVCLGNGEDVFAHAAQHLGDYKTSHCSALEWGWSGETGGA